MEYFQYINGDLHHYQGEQLVAVVTEENVPAYREFVPEAPLPAKEEGGANG